MTGMRGLRTGHEAPAVGPQGSQRSAEARVPGDVLIVCPHRSHPLVGQVLQEDLRHMGVPALEAIEIGFGEVGIHVPEDLISHPGDRRAPETVTSSLAYRRDLPESAGRGDGGGRQRARPEVVVHGAMELALARLREDPLTLLDPTRDDSCAAPGRSPSLD